MQTLTLLPECLNEKKDEWWENIHIYFLIIIKHIHAFLSAQLAGILRGGKKHILGNLAVRFECRMRSAFANRRIAHALSESL